MVVKRRGSPGQSAVSSWTSVWDERLTAPSKERRRRGANLELTARVRMASGEKRQESGIPVLLSTLLNIDDAGNDDADNGSGGTGNASA